MSDVSDRIDEVMAIDASAPALCHGGRWWSWGEVRRFGEQLGQCVQSRFPTGPGSQLAVVMRNRPPHVSAILHTVRRRGCLVPISSIQSPERIAEQVRELAPPVVLADAEDWTSHLAEATRAVGALGLRAEGPGLEVVVPSERHEDGPRRDGAAVWMPTSGTTGPPKRVPITYRDLTVGLDRVRRYARANEEAAGATTLSRGVVVNCAALVHIAGLWEVFQFAVEGRRMVLLDRFEPHAWSEAVAEHQPRVAMLPPAALTMLLEADVAPAMLRSLRAVLCGTAPLSPEVEERFTERFGIPVLTTYGATEFPGGLAGWSLPDKQQYGADRRGAVGRARPGVELRAVDPDSGNPVPAGQEGLVEVCSAQTAARGVEGWVRTTDMGRFDEDGFLWITGRADGAINRGGFKILPESVESALLEHPAVRSVGVVGLPDARLGHVPVAGVEVSSPVAEEELLDWARTRLLKYQVPARVVIVDALPRTPSLKVSRPQLREMLAGR